MVKSSVAFSSVAVHFLNVPDINECMVFRGLCANGRCRNTAEGFECDCNHGFAVDNLGTNCTGRLWFFLVDNLNAICTGKLRFQLMSLIVIVTEVFFFFWQPLHCHTGKMCFSRDVLPRVLRILTLLMLDSFKMECIC